MECECNKIGTVYLPDSGLSLCDKKTGIYKNNYSFHYFLND